MKTETKFNIYDLVNRKYERNAKNKLSGMEIMEVFTQTCYAGTQVTYLCRALYCMKEFGHSYKEEGEFNWIIVHGTSKEEHTTGWKKYREDELVPAKKEFIDAVNDNK